MMRSPGAAVFGVACLLTIGSAPALAQASLFPFYGFELGQLPEVRLYKTKSGGTPERSVKQAYFTRSLAGRIEGGEAASHCENDDVPAVLEKKPGRSVFLKLHYEPQPVSLRFTCRGKSYSWNVEYRTGVTVVGDVHTFEGYVRAVRTDDPTWTATATEKAVISVSGTTCKAISFKRSIVDEFFGHTRASRDTEHSGSTTCKLYAKG